MSPDPVERKLAAILSADVVGYSRLMAEDEAGTIRTLTDYREEIAMLVRQHRGRVVDSPGDNVLAEFPTALDAVQGAVEIQRVIGARNADLPAERRMDFRIGVHMGDVSVEGDRLYGDGVNIAARLEGLAKPGAVCISGTVYEQVEKKLNVDLEDLGEQTLKNIARPVHVYGTKLVLPRTEREEPEKDLPGMDELTVPGFGGRPAIAVLPFDNLSGDPEQEYFADGIAEDLITRLSSFRRIPVIARNSSFVYRGKAVDVKQVSRELGVRYVVEGSVRKAGDRVRISAQLIDATTGAHVWAERYDFGLSDIFGIQDEISQAIVASVIPQIDRSEMERLARKEPQDLAAWELVQKGFWHLSKSSREETEKARSLFQRAIEVDPELPHGFIGLAATYFNDVVNQGTDSPEHSVSEMVKAARKAVALDETDPYGQVTLSMASRMMGQLPEAIASLGYAIQLNPSNPLAYSELGHCLALQGRPEEALAHLEKAMRLSPQDPFMPLTLIRAAYAHFVAGRYEEMVEWGRRSLQRNPDQWFPYLYFAAAHAHLDRLEDARGALAELFRLKPDFSLDVHKRTYRYADPDAMERLIDGLRKAGLKE